MKLDTYLSDCHLTQREFAAAIGVSPNTVARYVSGRRIPSRDEMLTIVAATKGQVTPNDFFGVSEAKPTVEGKK